MIHLYKCKICDTRKEIDKPLAEQYRPTCCGKEMARVFYVPMIVAGALNGDNLAN